MAEEEEEEEEEVFISGGNWRAPLAVAWRRRRPTLDVERETLAA